MFLLKVEKIAAFYVKIVNPYHPNPEKIDDFDIAGSLGHK